MKKVYFILTFSGTVMARFIKLSTNDEFAHVSIALDKELKQMYSFGRRHPYNPFYGGFVHEGINHGTFKRFEKTTYAKIYTLDVTEYQYKKLRRLIKFMENSGIDYKFNIIGLGLAKFRMKLERENYFYCAEFVKKVMDQAMIKTNLPDVAKPEDFKYIDNTKLIYKGMLKNYYKYIDDIDD